MKERERERGRGNGEERVSQMSVLFLLADDGPQLPTSRSDEFKPFIRRLPEFKFW